MLSFICSLKSLELGYVYPQLPPQSSNTLSFCRTYHPHLIELLPSYLILDSQHALSPLYCPLYPRSHESLPSKSIDSKGV